MRDLYKILIILCPYMDSPLPVGIITYYDITYSVIDTVGDNSFGGYANCVVNTCIAFPEIEILAFSKAFDALFVLDALKSGVLPVVQAIV